MPSHRGLLLAVFQPSPDLVRHESVRDTVVKWLDAHAYECKGGPLRAGVDQVGALTLPVYPIGGTPT